MESKESEQINPWSGIWFQTRKTIRHILDTNPYAKIIWLSLANGAVSSGVWLATLWSKYPEEITYKSAYFIIFLLIIGALLGLVGLYLGGWLYKVVGRWIKGTGTFTDLKCATGWANYPFLIGNIFNFISYIAVNKQPTIAAIFAFIALILLIWGFIISLKLIGEAHRFSAWRALGSIILVFLLVFIVFMVVIVIASLIAPLFAK